MINVFEAFAGVKSQEMALRNIGVEYNSVGVSEVDQFAILSAAAIHTDFLKIKDSYNYPNDEEMWKFLELINAPLHSKTFEFIGRKLKGDKLKHQYLANILIKNYGDISKIDTRFLKDIDLFTYSFPCQDISMAGNMKGFEDGSGTKSSLLHECKRIIEDKRPKVLLLENVKNLVGKKFKGDFDKWLEYLEGLGYTNKWSVINSKDCNVPQNRERVFVASYLEDLDFKFTDKEELKLSIRDILEDNVDEKYYINKPFELVNKKMVKAECTDSKFDQNRRVYGIDGYFQCLGAAERGINKILVEAMIDDGSKYVETNRILSKNGISPTLTTMQGGRREPKILSVEIAEKVKHRKYSGSPIKFQEFIRSYKNDTIKSISDKIGVKKTEVEHWFRTDGGFSYPNSDIWNKLKDVLNIKDNSFDKEVCEFIEMDGKFEKSQRHYLEEGIAPTLQTKCDEKIISNDNPNKELRIRKLTPNECWRLMGFKDNDFHKASQVVSNSQLYKQAGNSIVVDVLERIFTNIYKK